MLVIVGLICVQFCQGSSLYVYTGVIMYIMYTCTVLGFLPGHDEGVDGQGRIPLRPQGRMEHKQIHQTAWRW